MSQSRSYWAHRVYHDLEEEPPWPTPYGCAVKRRASTDAEASRSLRVLAERAIVALRPEEHVEANAHAR